MRYESVDDASMYLSGSFVKYRGHPVLVVDVDSDVEGGITAVIHTVKTGKIKRVPLDSLNLTPLKLGYYYDRRFNRSFYVSRLPNRGWKQGLTKRNAYVAGVPLNYEFPRIGSKALVDMLSNKYLSFEEAKDKAKQFGTIYPFHKEFAVDYEGNLFYRGRHIGTSDGLSEDNKFLEEALQEAIK